MMPLAANMSLECLDPAIIRLDHNTRSLSSFSRDRRTEDFEILWIQLVTDIIVAQLLRLGLLSVLCEFNSSCAKKIFLRLVLTLSVLIDFSKSACLELDHRPNWIGIQSRYDIVAPLIN